MIELDRKARGGRFELTKLIAYGKLISITHDKIEPYYKLNLARARRNRELNWDSDHEEQKIPRLFRSRTRTRDRIRKKTIML